MDLKERAIYQLPNGRELVARVTDGAKVVLHNLSATEPGQYEVNSEGRLLFDGQLTAWEMHDLLDTGRMATPNLTAVLLDGSTAEGDNVRERNP